MWYYASTNAINHTRGVFDVPLIDIMIFLFKFSRVEIRI